MGVRWEARRVSECAACGEDHEIRFGVNSNVASEWPYIGRCDRTGRLVRMRFEID